MVPLTAGLPVEVQLGGLPIGQYTVQVVAADAHRRRGLAERRVRRGGRLRLVLRRTRVRWFRPCSRRPAGPAGVLTIVNSGTAPANVTVSAVGSGRPQTVTVAPGSSAALRLAAESVYLLDPGEGADAVRAGTSFAGDGALAAFPVWPSDAAAAPIVVYP